MNTFGDSSAEDIRFDTGNLVAHDFLVPSTVFNQTCEADIQQPAATIDRQQHTDTEARTMQDHLSTPSCWCFLYVRTHTRLVLPSKQSQPPLLTEQQSSSFVVHSNNISAAGYNHPVGLSRAIDAAALLSGVAKALLPRDYTGVPDCLQQLATKRKFPQQRRHRTVWRHPSRPCALPCVFVA